MTKFYEDLIYIAMCDTKEVQSLFNNRPATEDDVVVIKYLGEEEKDWERLHILNLHNDHFFEVKHSQNRTVQLPRQEDLQERLLWPVGYLLSQLDGYFRNSCTEEPYVISMEQVLLSFFMKEKYGLIWTGERWEAQRG